MWIEVARNPPSQVIKTACYSRVSDYIQPIGAWDLVAELQNH